MDNSTKIILVLIALFGIALYFLVDKNRKNFLTATKNENNRSNNYWEDYWRDQAYIDLGRENKQDKMNG